MGTGLDWCIYTVCTSHMRACGVKVGVGVTAPLAKILSLLPLPCNA